MTSRSRLPLSAPVPLTLEQALAEGIAALPTWNAGTKPAGILELASRDAPRVTAPISLPPRVGLVGDTPHLWDQGGLIAAPPACDQNGDPVPGTGYQPVGSPILAVTPADGENWTGNFSTHFRDLNIECSYQELQTKTGLHPIGADGPYLGGAQCSSIHNLRVDNFAQTGLTLGLYTCRTDLALLDLRGQRIGWRPGTRALLIVGGTSIEGRTFNLMNAEHGVHLYKCAGVRLSTIACEHLRQPLTLHGCVSIEIRNLECQFPGNLIADLRGSTGVTITGWIRKPRPAEGEVVEPYYLDRRGEKILLFPHRPDLTIGKHPFRIEG